MFHICRLVRESVDCLREFCFSSPVWLRCLWTFPLSVLCLSSRADMAGLPECVHGVPAWQLCAACGPALEPTELPDGWCEAEFPPSMEDQDFAMDGPHMEDPEGLRVGMSSGDPEGHPPASSRSRRVKATTRCKKRGAGKRVVEVWYMDHLRFGSTRRQGSPRLAQGFQTSPEASSCFPEGFPTASFPEAHNGSLEARKGLPGPKNAFCQFKVCVKTDPLRPATVFQFFGLALPPSCMPPYGLLHGETANGSLNVALTIRRSPMVV